MDFTEFEGNDRQSRQYVEHNHDPNANDVILVMYALSTNPIQKNEFVIIRRGGKKEWIVPCQREFAFVFHILETRM